MNHQANMTIAIRESDMEITDTYYRVKDNSIGYMVGWDGAARTVVIIG